MPTVTLRDNWQKDWNSDAAASKQQQHPTNPIQKKPIRKHGETRNSIESCRVWSRKRQNTSEHVRKDNVQCDQARMGRPVACDVGTLDFRIQVLLRNTVKKAEYVRDRELINRLENNPHRDEWKADVRQDNVCNAFSENSKKMIHDAGNVEYFELCETTSKVQCSYWKKHCVLYLLNLLVSHGGDAKAESTTNRFRIA